MTEENQRVEFDFDRDLAKFTPRQQEAVNALDSGIVKYLLYGGALGGGKSYFLRWFAVRFLMSIFNEYHLEYVTVMLACEDYPSLKDRQLQKVAREFPDWLGTPYSDHKEYGRSYILSREYGNGVICFRNLDDASKYASSEFAAILIDELTKNVYDIFTFVRTRLRWPGIPDLECPFVGGTNPGSVGHGWVKQLWITSIFPDEFIVPIDYRPHFRYIPSKASDNPHLDASYWAMLNTLPLHLRKAFRDGDWDIFAGQAFQEWNPIYHVVSEIPVPDDAPIYMTYDWGFGRPFSIGWWWVDSEGRVYRFKEWYGWNGTPDNGLRLADSAVAEGILQRENAWGIHKRVRIRLAGRDCFQKKANPMGGGQAPSTAEVFKKGLHPETGKPFGIILKPADSDRGHKIKQFRERLKIIYPDYAKIARSFDWFVEGVEWVDAKGHPHSQIELENKAREMGIDISPSRPMLLVYENCTHFIRTVPDLPSDENNIEDVDTNAEDHVYDEACHICVSRPIGNTTAPSEKEIKEKKRENLTNAEKAAWEELDRVVELNSAEEIFTDF